MLRLFFLLITFSVFFLGFPIDYAYAHALQPAYLNLQEREVGKFDVSWKVPFAGEGSVIPLDETPQFPDSCQIITPKRIYSPSGGILSRWTVDCGENGLYGQTITIKGLETSLNDVLLRLNFLEGQTYSDILLLFGSLNESVSCERIDGIVTVLYSSLQSFMNLGRINWIF